MSVTAHYNPYDENTESWTLYVERLEQYFIANEITEDARMKATLLTVIGSVTYATLRNIIAPVKPPDKSYIELIEALTKYYNPIPSEIVERFKFNTRDRREGETIAKYISELRRMSEFCNYTVTLDNMLRDRLVCGCRDDSLQKRLLGEENLTLAKAMAISQAMEQASQNVTAMKGQNTIQSAATIQAISILSKKRSNRTRRKVPKNQKWKAPVNDDQNRASSHKDKCTRCGNTGHVPANCQFKGATCHTCKKKGHIAKACYNRPPSRTAYANHVNGTNDVSHREYEVFTISAESVPLAQKENGIYHLPTQRQDQTLPDPYRISCAINDVNTIMEIDTGSAVSLMSSHDAKEIIKPDEMTKSNVRLKSFSGHPIEVIGISQVKVVYKSHQEYLPMVIYKGRGPILCGRSWLSSSLPIMKESIVPQANSVAHVSSTEESLTTILRKHQAVFDTQSKGCLKDVKIHLHRKPEITHKFFKARSVPYAYKEKVNEELQRLEEAKIISPIPFAQSAAPIVPVLKPNGKIRICGDFKVTANQQIETEKYPLPKAEDIFAKLAGCTVFTRLDMSDAYSQLELDDDSKDLVVINTPRGLFRYNYLPYGISSASAVFQKHMEALLRNQDGVTPFQDDILLGGADDKDHLKRLNSLLQIFEDSNLRLRLEKCQFAKSSIDFLGHRLDSQGLHPQLTKLTAISEAPEPKNVEELRSFLGLLNYYSKFIPNYAAQITPLYHLLEKASNWKWEKEEQQTFEKAKKMLTESNFLAHFDPTKEIRLAADASPTGIGAIISHYSDGLERPISFASRTLSPAEKNYSQLEKEALSLIYGVMKFRDYLLGRRFKLITDHQPLVSLLSENKPIPQMSAARLQRWALVLSAYNYQIEYKKGSSHSNADALSRLPLPVQSIEPPLPTEYVLLTERIDDSPTTTDDIRRATGNDEFLTKILANVIHGWREKGKENPEIKSYFLKRNELSTMKGLLMRGQRVVIPESLRARVLAQLHETHQGIVRMKSLARSTFWWPAIDEDIVKIIQQCTICQSCAPEPRKEFSPWPVTKTPWHRVHCDFAGPIENKYLFITVDAFTKWIEVDIVASTSTENVIRSLRTKMARFGIIRTLVTDNATCFTSDAFKEFTSENGILHTTIAPYHPQSNGQAERTVRTIKGSLKKLSEETNDSVNILTDGLKTFPIGTLEQRLSRILIRYRRTPLSCGKSPAELMLGRNIITRLDLCHPRNELERNQMTATNKTKFQIADKVFIRNYHRGPKWTPGEITNKLGNVMYEVNNGTSTVRKHQNQLKKRQSVTNLNDQDHEESRIKPNSECWIPTPLSQPNERLVEPEQILPPIVNEPAAQAPTEIQTKSNAQVPPRRSERRHKPIERLGL